MNRIFPVPKEQAFQREKPAQRWGRWEGREAGGSQGTKAVLGQEQQAPEGSAEDGVEVVEKEG